MPYKFQYCVFCRTGSERKIADEISRKYGIKSVIPIQEKFQKINGQREIVTHTFLPGYLFLYADSPINISSLKKLDRIYKVLDSDDGIYELMGSDAAFAAWLLENDGMVRVSRIRFDEGKYRVIDGPLKEMVENIIRIDKHTRNALVRLKFLDRVATMWFAFEFDDDL